MTVLAGRFKWDHPSHATPNRQAAMAAYGPYLKRFVTSVGALRAGAALACLKCARWMASAAHAPISSTSSSGGAAAALAKDGFVRKTRMRAGACHDRQ